MINKSVLSLNSLVELFMEQALEYGERWIFPSQVVMYKGLALYFANGDKYGDEVNPSYDGQMSAVQSQLRGMEGFFNCGAEGGFINRRHVVGYYWHHHHLQLMLSTGTELEVPQEYTKEALAALGHRPIA